MYFFWFIIHYITAETVPAANQNNQHDMGLDNTVPGMSDVNMSRPEPPASLSSHYREPSSVNDVDINRHVQSTVAQPNDTTEGTLDVRQEQEPLLIAREHRHRKLSVTQIYVIHVVF